MLQLNYSNIIYIFYRGLVKTQPPVIITEIVLVCFLKNNENKQKKKIFMYQIDRIRF